MAGPKTGGHERLELFGPRCPPSPREFRCSARDKPGPCLEGPGCACPRCDEDWPPICGPSVDAAMGVGRRRCEGWSLHLYDRGRTGGIDAQGIGQPSCPARSGHNCLDLRYCTGPFWRQIPGIANAIICCGAQEGFCDSPWLFWLNPPFFAERKISSRASFCFPRFVSKEPLR